MTTYWMLCDLVGFVVVALVILISKSPYRGAQMTGAVAMYAALEICRVYGLFRLHLGILGIVLTALGFVAVGAIGFAAGTRLFGNRE